MNKTTKKERKNIEFHYDLPVSFFSLFLGKYINYSCGFYNKITQTLDQGQFNKMDLICKKLRLEKNEYFLDIGCGFGSLIMHATKKYNTKSLGITLSKTQFNYAKKRINKEGLSKKCDIKLLNYRDISKNYFDKISSVGMAEHVGHKNLKIYYKTVFSALKNNGLFLNHTATTRDGMKYGPENKFMNKYIFPGGELIKIHELIKQSNNQGFELLSSENFRLHYAKTLEDWMKLMIKNKKQSCEIVPEDIYRAYLIYWAGCITAYKNQNIMLFQNLYQKNNTLNKTLNNFIHKY